MKIFTIESETNNISVYATAKEAEELPRVPWLRLP
jgi:hypothetical protein